MTEQQREVLKRAIKMLREEALGIQQGHTLSGNWDGEEEAKSAHDEMLAVASQLDALSHAEEEAFGWFTEDHDTDKSATTYDPVVADRWRKKGWPVWPLYTHPAPQVAVPELTDEMVVRGGEFLHDSGFRIDGDPNNATEQQQAMAEGLFSAMLAAAPTAPAGEPVVWPEPQEATTIEEYVGEYEYTDGEGHNYSPTETERALILDAIHGIPDHLLQPPKPAQQPVSNPDGLPSDWRRVVEGAADTMQESAKQHRGRGDNGTAAMCDRFGTMLRDEILSASAPDEREIAARAIERAVGDYFKAEDGPHNLHDYLLWRVNRLRAGKEGE